MRLIFSTGVIISLALCSLFLHQLSTSPQLDEMTSFEVWLLKSDLPLRWVLIILLTIAAGGALVFLGLLLRPAIGRDLLQTILSIFSGAAPLRNPATPAPGSNKHLSKFDELIALLEDYCAKAQSLLENDINAPQDDGVINCLLTNLLAMARCVLRDDPPDTVIANLMAYDANLGKLKVIEATSFLSFDAAMTTWDIDSHHGAPETHAGICARAFLTGQPQCIHETTRIKKMEDEPLEGIISVPITSHEKARHGDLAVINLNVFAAGFVPEKLGRQESRRVAALIEAAERVNDVFQLHRSNQTQLQMKTA